MRILTRYVVGEVLRSFLASLLGMTLMLTLGMGVREGLQAGLPPDLMLLVMPYMLPEILGITIPVVMLLAVSVVFGRMAGAHEITALKAAGITPMVVVWPVIILAFFVSLGTVWMYDIAATWGRPGVERVVTESVEEIAYGMLRTNRSFKSRQFSIAVKSVRGRKLVRPTITISAHDGGRAVTLSAEEAELRSDTQAGTITILCRNADVEVEGQLRVSFSDTIRQVIPFEKPVRPMHRDWLGMGEIPRCLELVERDCKRLEARLSSQPTASPADRKQWAEQLADCRRKVFRLRTEPYRRWSNGFSVLCFTLIGLPVAMWRRSNNFLTTFFVCFTPILVIYYPLLMVGEDLSTSGALPPVSFWLGNVVLALPGVWLLHWYCRY